MQTFTQGRACQVNAHPSEKCLIKALARARDRTTIQYIHVYQEDNKLSQLSIIILSTRKTIKFSLWIGDASANDSKYLPILLIDRNPRDEQQN